jgi:hypothetical protein
MSPSSMFSSPAGVNCLNLKMEAICLTEILGTVYQAMQHNIPEDFNFHQHYCENLKPGIYITDDLTFT